MTGQRVRTIQQNLNMSQIDTVMSVDEDYCRSHQAYDEGRFHARERWLADREWNRRIRDMAQHRDMVWEDLLHTFPEWEHGELARAAFYIGYEDAAWALADAGEAGYEELAEAGTVADTAGWQLQSAPWPAAVTDAEKAFRPLRAAWAGAAAWQARAAASGDAGDANRAEEALLHAETFIPELAAIAFVHNSEHAPSISVGSGH